MPNSGYVTYTNLEQYYLDNNIATGYIKPNNISDPDYVPMEYNTDLCPLPSATPSISVTPSITPTVTPTVTPTITVTPTVTLSVTATPSITPSITSTISVTPSITPTRTPSKTPSVTPSVTKTPSVTPSITPTITVTPTRTPSITPTPSTPLTAFLSSGMFGVNSGDIVFLGGYGCITYEPTITYYITGPINVFSLIPSIGGRVYTSFPSSPVNGNNLWVGVKCANPTLIGTPTLVSIKVDTNGYITDIFGCP